MTTGAARIVACYAGLVIGLTACFVSHAASPADLPDRLPKVLIFPFQVIPGKHAEDLATFNEHVNKRLRSALEQIREACVVEPAQVAEGLLGGQAAPETADQAYRLAAEAGADMVLYGHLSEDGSGFHMKALMGDLRSGRQAVSVDLKVENIHALPAVLELFISGVSRRLHGRAALPFYAAEPSSPTSVARPARLPLRTDVPRNTGPWRSPQLPSEVWALAIGDLDGDNKNETIFIEDGAISIGRYEDGVLRPLTQFSRAPARFFAVEMEPSHGNVPAQLIVSSLTPLGVESSIIEYEHRDFKVTQRIPNVILRPIHDPAGGTKRILVGQRTDVPDMFSGEMIRYDRKDRTLVESGTLALPPGTLLLSYVAGELGKRGELLRVVINQDQRLMVFNQENRLLYEASDRIYGLNRALTIPGRPRPREVVYPSRLMIADTDGDGENELLVIKQSGDVSMINALVWDGERLVEKWKTIGSRGIISDFTIGDLKNTGTRSLLLSLVEPAVFPAWTRSRSQVFAYDLIP